MKKTFLILFISVFLASASFAEIKQADLAGTWYPGSRSALSKMVNGFLEKADVKEVEGEIIGLISPHAGYIYSGPVAAYGYKLIKNRNIKTVIIVGFNHRMYHKGIAVCDFDSYKTPLGEVPIDKELTSELIARDNKIYPLKKAFYNENSTEMQIPFLQMVLRDFKLLIIHMGDQSLENSRILSDALYKVLRKKENFILIASTDMSHFLSYDNANEIDAYTISEIKKFEPIDLYTESSLRRHNLMCGYGAVCATMMASKKLGADGIEVLRYANSGDETFDRRRVVGYLSAAIVKSQKRGDTNMLSEQLRKKMLKLARDAIMFYLKEGKPMPVKEDDPILNKEMGAFVTLHKHGQLRGCIGNMIGHGPFYLTVRDMAIEAATGDQRFAPVTLDEINDIDIEISALSPMQKITDPDKIEAGKHGVMVRSSFRSGVYLPQVATETGWNREQFMNSLCGHKAGIAPDAWKKGQCEIYIFTAEVFGEKE
ncbi:MAG: AmmeMemoRadiSam system protein B [Candidatus Omnitrophica bacterium]|nr:AmmeMemoRadiSam system protein B [Candidatus Omnitrophota bacterium]